MSEAVIGLYEQKARLLGEAGCRALLFAGEISYQSAQALNACYRSITRNHERIRN